MNLSITLFDDGTNVLPRATLAIRYRLPDGKTWRSGPLEADDRGRIDFPLDNNHFRAIDFAKAGYVISFNGEKYEGRMGRRPTAADPRLHLNAKTLSIGGSVDEGGRVPVDRPDPRNSALVLNIEVLRADDGQPLKNTPLTLVPAKGPATAAIDLGTTDGKGQLEHVTTAAIAAAVMAAGAVLANGRTGQVYDVVDPKAEEAGKGAFNLYWNVKPRPGEVTPSEDGDRREDEKDPANEPPRPPEEVKIIGTVLVDDKPLAGALLGLRWTRKTGLVRDLQLPRTSRDGAFIWTGSPGEVLEAVLFEAQLYDRDTLEAFAIVKAADPQPMADGMEFRWNVRRTGEQVSRMPDLQGGDLGLVSGMITANDGQPQVGLIVRAYDVDVPEEELLGEAVTDDDGFYAINYAAGTALAREKDALDIVVRVFAGTGTDKPAEIATSPMRENAPLRLLVDIVTGEQVWPGESLYGRIHDAVRDVMKGASLRTLKPTQVVFLAARTKYRPVDLARYVGAWALALAAGRPESDQFAAAAFFGWLATEMPAHPAALALQPMAKLEAALDEAIAANLIPERDYTADLSQAAKARTAIIANHQPELIEYLGAGGLSRQQAETVIGIFLEGLNAAERQTEIKARIPGQKGDRVLDLIEMWQALGGNTSLGIGILKSTKVAVPRDLVELTAGQLAQVALERAAIPAHIHGNTEAERAETFAEERVRAFETRYPMAYFAHQLTLSNHKETRDLGQRLKTALEMEPLRLGATDPVLLGGWDQKLVDLGSLYFSAHPARRAPLVDQLIRNGFLKAPDITAQGLTNFRARIQEGFEAVGDRSDADVVFRRASLIVSVARAVKMQELSEQIPQGGVPDTLARQIFQGSINGTCPHCESMISPAAYLLDLVRYADKASTSTPGRTGWDRIDERRPDLKNIHLDCANAETPMPHIDLALEVLEDQVAAWPNPPRQTTRTAEELAERPAFVNDAAYAALRDTTFPWIANYNRGADLTVRALEQAGLCLPDLLDAAGLDGDAARLGLWSKTSVTYGTTPQAVARSMDKGSWNRLTAIKTLPDMASHLQLDPETIYTMLRTRFVSGSGEHLVAENGALDWTKLTAPILARFSCLGQMAAQSTRPMEEIAAWLELADPSQPDWQAEYAAGLRLAKRARLGVSDVAMLAVGGEEARLGDIADLAGVSLAAARAVATALSIPAGTLRGLDALHVALDGLTDGGKRDLDVLLALLAPPALNGPFDPGPAALAIEVATTSYLEAFPDMTGDPGTDERLVVAEALAGPLSADPAALGVLLTPDHVVALRAGALPVDEVIALCKEARLLAALDLDAVERNHIAALAAKGWLPDLGSLGNADLAGLSTLAALADLNAARYRREDGLFARLAAMPNTLLGLAEALALPDLPRDDVLPLLGAGGLALGKAEGFFSAEVVRRVGALISACLHLSTGGQTLLDIVSMKDGEAAWEACRAVTAGSAWPKAARQISDPLRERCRDALLAKVIHASRSGQGRRFETPYDVYGHFLIDTEMMAPVDTSRIKLAIASIQQFVQRVQLGLEPGVRFSQNDAGQWAWRKNYRVWEANRKVMVFPENWVRPELRDNKTDLYRAFESELLKGDISAETAEQALIGFARGLHEVAGLEMCALHEDKATDTTYILGRTREMPAHYYLNSRGPNGLWQGWEKIDVEIEGDHVMPVVYARRVFLAWVTFDTKVAVDDPDYLEILSVLEAEQNTIRDDIDALKRKITDIENKKEENSKKVDKNYGHPMDLVYSQLDDHYGTLLGTMEGELTGLRAQENLNIRAINALKDRFTYCDATLSLTQRKRGGGWEPVIKSRSAIPTILNTTGIGPAEFFSNTSSMFVEPKLRGKTLEFDLNCGYLVPGNLMVRGAYLFGTFTLDVVNNVLRVTERRSKTESIKDGVIAGPATDRQKLSLITGVRTLDFLDPTAERVLSNINEDVLRIIPAELRNGTSVIMEQAERSYLVEKVRAAPPTHPEPETALVRQTPRIAPRGTEGLVGDVLDPRNIPSIAIGAGDRWQFTPLFHPFTETVVTELYRYGLDGLYVPDADSGEPAAVRLNRQQADLPAFAYGPTAQVAEPRPRDRFSFSRKDPFGTYNWELFFHAPFAIAEHLRQNRRFEEARRWFHFIFNPTERDSGSLANVWRFGPFHREHLRIINGDSPDLMDDADNPDFAAQVEEWERNPFNPHAVARMRTTAYMRAVYLAYLDNLIEWGDDLFRRDTMESVNEAAQLYVLAAEMLGPRPVILPRIEDGETPKSIGEALSWMPDPERIREAIGKMEAHPDNTAVGTAFFELFGDFCMPSNDRLLGVWTRLSDRLFKIRNSLDIDGAFRKMPLFQPPIDPALLVRAAASGLSIADAVAGASSRRPHYRFSFMVQKALDYAADVRGLGAALLAALEKKDAEALTALRANHEVAMSRQMRSIYQERIKEQKFMLASNDAELDRMTREQTHFEDLIAIGDLPTERDELNHLTSAHGFNLLASQYHAISSALSPIPQVGMNGPTPNFSVGGIHLSSLYRAFGDVAAMAGSQFSFDAAMAGRTSGRIRRGQEWARRVEDTKFAIKKLQQDRLATEIRLAIAEKDLEQHDARTAQAEETETFLKGKFTNEALYGWMVDRLSALHFQSFRLASDLARQAQACFRDEMSDPAATFIEAGHWDSLRKGLLAGEHLTLDLRRMEAAYLGRNRRVHELSKSISLAQLDPVALLALRRSGTAGFSLPEYLFDLDHAGHVNRRIKSVNVTIPALAGPQTSMACSITLTASQIRRKGADGTMTLEAGPAGETVATSTGQNDTGMFQFDFNDPRYLKFEGAGVVASWNVELPDPEVAQFDYGSITDLILQVHYTAEDGPPDHVAAVKSGLRQSLADLGHQSRALFSLRYDFPADWARLRNDESLRDISLDLGAARFPYLYARRSLTLTELSLTTLSSLAEEVVDQTVPLVGQGLQQIGLSDRVRAALSGSAHDVLMVVSFEAGPA